MEIPKEYENNIIWKEKLKEAIQENRIIAFFQPIINNRTGKIEKYETLVRMVDDNGNIIAPHYFLDIAKKTHLYGDITRIMMDRSFDAFKNNEYEFSINLTIKDILDDEINYNIQKKIKDNHNLSKRLVFEVLESEGIENYKEVITFIQSVKQAGCKIAIDDFGSGYSNFDHIMRLDVDYIKIDSSLIKNIDKDFNAQIITKTIANFSKELGLKTISEFVHSKEVYEKAVGLGVDYSQGNYFGEARDVILMQI
jgi:c-di-GMP phosphodiesterase